jgi:sugar phosphate isomerase/epimerase
MAFAVPLSFQSSYKDNSHAQKNAQKRKFSMSLNPFLIGVRPGIDQRSLNDLAIRNGFESVAVITKDIMGQTPEQLDETVAGMKAGKLGWGVSGLPVEYRKDEATFRNGLKDLPGIAKRLNKVGANRMMTWIMSNDTELNYLRNFRQTAVRLGEIAAILKHNNIRLGLEYVGPKSIWAANKFPFVHTMAETKELIAAIGQPNVGFHLDTAHWYTSGETTDDLLTLTNKDVVGCDLNDAVVGFSKEDQPGYKRELPVTTGMIDASGFLNALINIGFDGPIQAEPFNESLNLMDDESAIKVTANAMRNAFKLVAD